MFEFARRAWLAADRQIATSGRGDGQADASNRPLGVVEGETLTSHLQNGLADMLRAEQATGVKCFGRGGFDRIVDGHLDGVRNHIQVLGFLTTAEFWRQQIVEAARLTQSSEPKA